MSRCRVIIVFILKEAIESWVGGFQRASRLQQGGPPVSFRWQSESEEFEWEAAVVSNCLARAEAGTAGFGYRLEMRNTLLEAGGTGNCLDRDTRWLPSRLIPHRHRPRTKLQPAHELQVDALR